jgi:hypothetical protein
MTGIEGARYRAAMLDGFRRARDWLLDQVIAAWFGILDWLAPLPEAPVDRRAGRKANGCAKRSP